MRALDLVERAGNRLPSPATLFVVLALGVVVASAIAAAAGVSVIHPRDGSTITPVSLLTRENVRRMFTDSVRNFMAFAPLGTVLVAMIGIGVAEAAGLVSVTLRGLVLAVPRRLLTATVVFTGLVAHVAADAGLVVLPPVAAALFASVGRHPLAGVAAAFAGVAGGFSANIVPSTLDVLLASLTDEALVASKLLAEPRRVEVLGNYFFLALSTPMLTFLGAFITEKVVEPRLGAWTPEPGALVDPPASGPTALERKGLVAAAIALAVMLALTVVLALPGGPLVADGATMLERLRPFFDSMITLVLVVFLVPGIAYGVVVGKIRSDHDVAKMASDTIAVMGPYIVLAFAASQFIAYFAWSNLGAIVAISGAGLLRSLELGGPLLTVAFVLFSAAVNLMISSASAKWAIMAPVFVPMFYLLGYSPEGTQVMFRVGDSSTNIVTPLLPYVPIILAVMQRYDKKAGTGTLMAMMVPYSLTFLVAWTTLLVVFQLAGWPIGPGVHLELAP